MSATDLAGRERISHQAVATAARELEELGLVSRSPDPTDGRRMLLTITEQGRGRLGTELAAGQDWLLRAVTDHLDAEERAALAATIPLLTRLNSDTVTPEHTQ